jgi:hypothetical protein
MTHREFPGWLRAWSADSIILTQAGQEATAADVDMWVEHYVESGQAAREWEARLRVQRREIRQWEQDAIAQFLVDWVAGNTGRRRENVSHD